MASVAKDIKDAAVTALTTLAANYNPAPEVVARKTQSRPKAGTLPQWVVSLGKRGKVEDLFANTVLVSYTLTVGLYQETDATLKDDSTLEEWVQEVGRELDDKAPFATINSNGGANEINRIDYPDLTGGNTLQNAAILRWVVEVVETRN